MGRQLDREAELEVGTAPDRRRSGRINDVSPELIPLLRGTSTDQDAKDPDQLSASRSIAVWVLISVALWALLGGLLYIIV